MSFMSVREGRKGQGPSVSHCSPEGMAHTPQPAQTLPTLSSMPLCHHSGPVAMLMGGSRHAHPEGGISAPVHTGLPVCRPCTCAGTCPMRGHCGSGWRSTCEGSTGGLSLQLAEGWGLTPSEDSEGRQGLHLGPSLPAHWLPGPPCQRAWEGEFLPRESKQRGRWAQRWATRISRHQRPGAGRRADT